jgi:hypothetical protein
MVNCCQVLISHLRKLAGCEISVSEDPVLWDLGVVPFLSGRVFLVAWIIHTRDHKELETRMMLRVTSFSCSSKRDS